MLEVKTEFTKRELLLFGPLFSLFVALIGLLLIRRFELQYLTYGIWAFSAILIVIYYLRPSLRVSIYRGWIFAVMPIGWVISHVLLALIYYLLLTPVGLAMRMLGYDPMHRQFDTDAMTYWKERDAKSDPQSYFRQF